MKAPAPKPAAATSYDDDEDALIGSGPVEETTITTPDGEVVTVKYRGVDASLLPGSAEWKKAKRLADNRASAARSRALQRVRVNEIEVSQGA